MSSGGDSPFGGSFNSNPKIDAWSHPGFQGRGNPSPQEPTRYPQTPGMAYASLALSIASVVTVCTCVLPMITAFLAVVFGHLARGKIRRSEGALAGGGIALTGLILGYGMLVVSTAQLAFLIVAAVLEPSRSDSDRDMAMDEGAKHLARAERLIGGDGKEIAFGNNEEARLLARAYASRIKQARDDLFTQRKRPASKDQFVTYCALNRDTCAFVVFVPDYNNFKRDAKDDLAEIAWLTAQGIASSKLQPGDGLAVALKGRFVFGSIRVGEVTLPGGERNAWAESEKEDLHEFFVSDEPVHEMDDPDAPPPMEEEDAEAMSDR